MLLVRLKTRIQNHVYSNLDFLNIFLFDYVGIQYCFMLVQVLYKKTLSQQERFQYPYNYNAKFINKEYH